jgi:hypothetical protein
VDTYGEAQAAFEEAYSQAHNATGALDAEVKGIAQRFERAMGAEDLSAAIGATSAAANSLTMARITV